VTFTVLRRLLTQQLPGLGYLYSGLTRRKNALSLLFLAIVSLAIVSFQWFFIGYSLVFSATGGVFLGDGAHVGFRGVLDQPIGEANNRIPAIVFATYQMVSLLSSTRNRAYFQMFAALVPAILLGAAAERSRMLPALIFIFCWTTVVYDPIAHWVWSANGWAFKWGVLDCKSHLHLHAQG
jgi:Amt family ammonium transporter